MSIEGPPHVELSRPRLEPEANQILRKVHEYTHEEVASLSAYCRLDIGEEIKKKLDGHRIFFRLLIDPEMEGQINPDVDGEDSAIENPKDVEEKEGEIEYQDDVSAWMNDCKILLKEDGDSADLSGLVQIAKALLLGYERFNVDPKSFDQRENLQATIYKRLVAVFPADDPVVVRIRHNLPEDLAYNIDRINALSIELDQLKKILKKKMLPRREGDLAKPSPTIGDNELYGAVKNYFDQDQMPFADIMDALLEGFPERSASE